MDPRKASTGENRVVPVETTVPVPVDPKDPNKVLNVGSQLNVSIQNVLISFLKANLDVFAWNHLDMCRISPNVMVHNVTPHLL